MWEHGIHVTEGMTITAGQHIGDVGSSGKANGPPPAPRNPARRHRSARLGAWVALGAAALAGAGIAWVNFLLGVGEA